MKTFVHHAKHPSTQQQHNKYLYLQQMLFVIQWNTVSSTDDRAYKYRKVIGEESPSFIGQSAG